MTSTWYLMLVVLYLPLMGFAQDNSTSVSEKRSDSNLNITSLNLTNASTICNLRIRDPAIKNIVRLMHIHTTNVVEIEVSIDSWNKTRIFKWSWASKIGQTIISLIAHPTLSVASSLQHSTLTRGTLKAQVVVSEENYGCLPAGKNGSDRVFGFLLHQLSRAEDDHDYDHYKLCRALNKENVVKQYNCCRAASDGKLSICAEFRSIILEYADGYLSVMIYIVCFIFLPVLPKYLRSFEKESDSYEINYSPMALSSIFFMFFYGSDNVVKSRYRRFAFSLTVAVGCSIYYSPTWIRISALIWVLFFTAFDIFGINVDPTDKIDEHDLYNIYLTTLILPFNFKCLWNLFESTLECCNCNPQQQPNLQQPTDPQQLAIAKQPANPEQPTDLEQQANTEQSTNPQQPTTCTKQACRKFTKGLCFVLLYLGLLLLIIFFSLFFAVLVVLGTLCLALSKYRYYMGKYDRLFFLVAVFFFILQIVSVVFIMISANFFLKLMLFLIAGLFLNVEYYGPIIVPTVGLIVYSWKHWRSLVETEYLQLKTKIYDVCKELRDNPPSDSNPNYDERNDLQFWVDLKEGKVSKDLYEKIREKNSPYHKVLFDFFARTFFVANFFLVVAVMMLLAQETGISGPARIMSTLIVSMFPFFFDSVWAEHTSQQADVNGKKLELQLRKIIRIKSRTDDIITVTLENEENETNQLPTIMDVFK